MYCCGEGSNTWPVVRDLVEEVVCVSEEEIMAAMRLVWERMKLVRLCEESLATRLSFFHNHDGQSVRSICR